MQDAVATGEGAMAAILNVEMSTLEQICADSVVGAGCCQIANDNAPGQIVISGDLASVERAMAAATKQAPNDAFCCLCQHRSIVLSCNQHKMLWRKPWRLRTLPI